jgi:hypothetical protein
MGNAEHYNYFRDYDPGIERYVQSDPIGLKAGLNTYGYVGANTLIRADPLGLMEDCSECGTAESNEPDDPDTASDDSALLIFAAIGGGGAKKLVELVKRCKNIRCKFPPEVHDAHHPFIVIGRQCHLQLTCYSKGVSKSHINLRVPFPCDWSAPPGFQDKRRTPH